MHGGQAPINRTGARFTTPFGTPYLLLELRQFTAQIQQLNQSSDFALKRKDFVLSLQRQMKSSKSPPMLRNNRTHNAHYLPRPMLWEALITMLGQVCLLV
jgi:hypothetical protein